VSALRGPRAAVAAAAAGLIGLQLLGDIGALLTGGVMVMLLSLAVVILVLRPRPRGWIIAAGLLAGVGLFVLPWSLFVAQQTRAAGGDANIWSWTLAVIGLLALGAAAWMLRQQPRASFAIARSRVASLSGVVTAAGALAALAIAVLAATSGLNPALALAMLVGSWVLLRTLRPAEPGRHLGDVTTATGLLACLVWWVFVGTLQGATGGLGMLAITVVVFLAVAVRTGHAADAVLPARHRPEAP
jgi:hypothetical protein